MVRRIKTSLDPSLEPSHQDISNEGSKDVTVKILKFGTPQIIAIMVLKIEKFYVTLHLCIQKMLMEWQTA